MLVSEIINITNGKLLSGNPKIEIDLSCISSDSRTIKKGDFFLPLKGRNFNGENFIKDAFRKGAIGTLTEGKGSRVKGQGKLVIHVKDTTEALQKIAHHHRMKFKIPVIGITGSNGKTTVKDMISTVLSSKYNVLKNEGTKNNHIGVPQTILKLKKPHDACVLEMGTNHKGEIRLLADIARPDIVVITNIGPSHLQFLKDLKGVYESKKEIFSFLKKGSPAVLNGDDRYLSGVKSEKFRIIHFGFENSNEFYASHVSTEKGRIKFLLNGKKPFTLNMIGVHNVYNALAAIALARNFGLSYESIKRRLASYVPTYMRLNIKNISGVAIIDDAYNSNPLSMSCAIEAIKSYPARSRWIVSADMLELGKKEDDFHDLIGEEVAKGMFDGLITFGNLSKHTYLTAIKNGMPKNRVWHCVSHEEIASILKRVAKSGDAVLIKGSRSMSMEEVIKKFGKQETRNKR